MTRKEKTNELHRRINALCPDLMELRFGCEFHYSYKHFTNSSTYNNITKRGVLIDTKNYGKNWLFGVCKGNKNARWYSKEEVKILGIPPTLSDVLRSIGDGHISVDEGRAWIWDDLKERSCCYNLTLSPLDQSEETLDFLLSVIDENHA